MAKKEKVRDRAVLLDMLYVGVVIVLLVAIVAMYGNWRHKRARYAELVREAIEHESITEIQTDRVLENIVEEGDS